MQVLRTHSSYTFAQLFHIRLSIDDSISKSISLPSITYKLQVLTGDSLSSVFRFVYVLLLKCEFFGPLTNFPLI